MSMKLGGTPKVKSLRSFYPRLRIRVLLWGLLFFSFSLHAGYYNCRAFLAAEIERAKLNSETHFLISDLDSGAYINAKLSEGGTMTFSIRTRDSSGNLLNPRYKATELFDAAMRHFGSRVKAIHGEWLVEDKIAWMGDYSASTNLVQFNKYLVEHQAKKGSPTDEEIHEAARNTWTGRQAARYGFKKVRILVGAQSDDLGNHSHMNVEFTKQ